MKPTFKLLGYTLIIATLFVACSKPVDNKLQGRWKKVLIDNGDVDCYWEITDGNIYVSYPDYPDRVDTGSYKVKRKLLSRYITIFDIAPSLGFESDINGDWFIHELNNDYLKVAKGIVLDDGKQHGLMQKEFLKVP
jgi:hypothetical protein